MVILSTHACWRSIGDSSMHLVYSVNVPPISPLSSIYFFYRHFGFKLDMPCIKHHSSATFRKYAAKVISTNRVA